MDIETTVARARDLRREDKLEESRALLLDLLQEYPEDPLVLYEVGGAYDVLEEAREAIPFYERAIAGGLSGDDLQECLICLGICHRGLGDSSQAVAVLEQSVAQFPDDQSGRVFLALAYYSDGQYEAAVRELLEVLLETTQDENILTYMDTLEYYKENLDEIWDE